jgi:hypothetical protein
MPLASSTLKSRRKGTNDASPNRIAALNLKAVPQKPGRSQIIPPAWKTINDKNPMAKEAAAIRR